MKRRDVFKAAAAAPVVALAQNSDWKPLTLSAEQNETVVILADLIIPTTDTPGAKEANVNRYIDLFLTDGRREQRRRFLSGLELLDEFTAESHDKPFRACTREQQTALLKQMADGIAPEDVTEFFEAMKRMTSRIYYNTAIGYRELNKGGHVPKTFGCSA